MTYVQIHEDTVKDLLVEQNTPRLPAITLREHATKGICMDNARSKKISTPLSICYLLLHHEPDLCYATACCEHKCVHLVDQSLEEMQPTLRTLEMT